MTFDPVFSPDGLYYCRSQKHEWVYRFDAEHCCNGYVQLYIPYVLAHGWTRLEHAIQTGDNKLLKTMMSYLEKCYAMKKRVDERAYTSSSERGAWQMHVVQWISESETEKIQYVRSIMPLRYLARMDKRREEEYI